MSSSDKFFGRSVDKTAADELTASLKANWKFITFKLDIDAPISVVSMTRFLKKKKKKPEQLWLLINLVQG